MSGYFNWSAWNWDWMTAWIVLWMIQFALIEWFGSANNNMVTDHLRPMFHAAPLTWWLALGCWLWLGPHMLWPAFEEWLRRVVGQ